jgi:hypothetical protein
MFFMEVKGDQWWVRGRKMKVHLMCSADEIQVMLLEEV